MTTSVPLGLKLKVKRTYNSKIMTGEKMDP